MISKYINFFKRVVFIFLTFELRVVHVTGYAYIYIVKLTLVDGGLYVARNLENKN